MMAEICPISDTARRGTRPEHRAPKATGEELDGQALQSLRLPFKCSRIAELIRLRLRPRARNSPSRPRPSRPAGEDKRPSITGLRDDKIFMKLWEVRHAGMGRGRLSGFSRCLHFAT
jgi:hypothetical protein